MREGASFSTDIREDLVRVLAALGGARQRTTEELSEDTSRPLARVRGALQLLRSAGVVTFTARRYAGHEGYTRVWSFKGAGTVNLWEPAQEGRRRRLRLYLERGAAVEASRRTMGPGAGARAVVYPVGITGKVG